MGFGKRRQESKVAPPDHQTFVPKNPISSAPSSHTQSTTSTNVAKPNENASSLSSILSDTGAILRSSNLDRDQIKIIEDHIKFHHQNERKELREQREALARENCLFGEKYEKWMHERMVQIKEADSQNKRFEKLKSEIKDLLETPELVTDLRKRAQKAEENNKGLENEVERLKKEVRHYQANIR